MQSIQSRNKILSNRRISGKYFKLKVFSPHVAAAAVPGQFVMVQVKDGIEPLLRRPLGVHKTEGGRAGSVELLYEVVGKGTELLSQKKPGECLDIIGPLGNGFDYKPQAAGRKLQILVAGGMGAAPLFFLAEKINGSKPLALLGARTKAQVICEKEFKQSGCAVKVATDDGSKGFKGRVTELLKKELSAAGRQQAAIYACGPEPMLRAVADISNKCNIPAQLSLEAHMSCGFGACLGCVVNTVGGYKRVCKEGPVFNANEIVWAPKLKG